MNNSQMFKFLFSFLALFYFSSNYLWAQKYMAILSGANESPANSSPAVGRSIITITGTSMRVQSNFSGLIGSVTAAHIHAATTSAFTGNAGVATVTPTFTGFPSGVTSGTYDHTFDMSFSTSFNPSYITAHGSVAQAWADLQTAIVVGKSYFNIHTNYLPGGEIRGFLVPFTCTSVKSGNWTDPAVWTYNDIPTSLDKVVISSGHIVSIPNNLVVNVKNIEINGELKCGFNSNLKLNQ